MEQKTLNTLRQCLLRCVRPALYAAGGYMAALCSLDGRAPLAAGAIAALWPMPGGAAALCGCLAGAASFMRFSAALRCGGALVLLTALLGSFRDTAWIRHPLFRPLSAAGAVICVEIAYMLKMGVTVHSAVELLAYAALSAALCHYLSLLMRRVCLPARRESGEAQALRKKLRMSADALRSIFDSICTPVKSTEENPAVIFDRAAEVVCRGCAMCEVCWSREYTETFNAFNDATPAIMKRGRAEGSDFALHFSSRCIHFPQLLSAINTEVSALLLRRQYRRRIETERQRTRGQYAQLSELVVETLAADAPEIKEMTFNYDVALTCRPKEGQRVCGDSAAYFTGGGKLHLLLSDGMGSGIEAQRESKMALRLLKQFLTAGIEAETALRTLNSALNLRADEHGSFTTVDLLSVDHTGREAQLIKYGAAPTYIKRRGSVRRVTGHALPAGLQAADSLVSPVRFSLEEDTFVLMISDGIADSGEDIWLSDLLAGWQGEDPNKLVSLVMQESRKRKGTGDDSSAMCLYIPPQRKGRQAV